jgi:hypothetical protein
MMLLAIESTIKAVINFAVSELTRLSVFSKKTCSRIIPQRIVVITKESGVKGVFHEITEGIIYSIIILKTNNKQQVIMTTENTFSVFLKLALAETIRYSRREASNIVREKISLLSQLFPRLFIALKASIGFPR